MEVLAVVGIVSSIVQLVDFGAKLISKTDKLYRTGHVASMGAPAMEAAAADLRMLTAKLRGDAKLAADPLFDDLCNACEKLVDKLLMGLRDITTNTKQRMWTSIRKAFKAVWTKAEFEELERMLEAIRNQLNLRLSVDIREKVAHLLLTTSEDLSSLDSTAKSILEAIEAQHDVFMVQTTVHLALVDILRVQDQYANAANQEKQLAKLPNIPEAAFNSIEQQHEPLCLQETRVALLQTIERWIAAPSEKHLFWLSGLGGTGKTTIALTVAQRHGHFTASFFFSRGGGDRGHPRNLFTSVAVQLAARSPILKQYICNAIEECNNISSLSLIDQWRYLILTPLSRLGAGYSGLSLLLVFDALDECGDERDIKTIIQLLAEARTIHTCRVRILVTSRPDHPIRAGFSDIPGEAHKDCVLHDLNRTIVDHDIQVYFEHNFEVIRKERSLPTEWPGARNIHMLVRKSSGLFIWAATACRFVREGKRFTKKRLSSILEGGNPDIAPETKLDNIYLTVLANCIGEEFTEAETEEMYALLRNVLGSLVTLYAPLATASLASLLNIPEEDIMEALEDLYAILDIPPADKPAQPIRLHHPSFRDFLLNKDRCKEERFLVQASSAHTFLAQRCIQLLSRLLKRDICSLHSPGLDVAKITSEQVSGGLPPQAQYACIHWVHHLRSSDIKLDDQGPVHIFLQNHLLHWLEALSLIGRTSDGVHALIALETSISPAQSPDLHSFVDNAKKFILNNRSIIAQAPLQIYHSALVFASELSIIRSQFHSELPAWIEEMPVIPPNSGANLHILEGHRNWVRALAFSPDNIILASSSADKTIKLWDTVTGETLQTIDAHSDWVYSIAFSSDGTLASGSSDKTVKLWACHSGSLLRVLEGHGAGIRGVSFSKDPKLLASGGADMTVRLWDTESGRALRILRGHTQWIYSVAFSHSGMLASASADSTVKIWDPHSGALLHNIDGYTSAVRHVAFSADGRLMAAVTSDKSVWLWANHHGERPDSTLHQLEGHSEWSYGVAVAPDGGTVASVSADRTVKLWNTASRRLMTTLHGHTDWLFAVAFSPDGRLLASAGADPCIRVWGVQEAGTAPAVPRGHATPIHAMAVSADGRLVATAAMDDFAVKLWQRHGRAGGPPLTMDGHTDWIFALAFSPDGTFLASCSDDRTVRLWDTAGGDLVALLQDHGGGVRGLAFSADGCILASASDDKTAKLWSLTPPTLAAAGRRFFVTRTIRGHTGYVRAVAFSDDGASLATSSDDKTVRLWNIRADAAQPTGVLVAHRCSVRAIAFSPDASLLVSASADGAIYLWDRASRTVLQRLRVDVHVSTVRFSREGPFVDTNRGSLRVDCYAPPQENRRGRAPPGGMFLHEHWISREGAQSLWLPPQHRPTSAAFVRDTFVLGHSDGLVSCIALRSA